MAKKGVDSGQERKGGKQDVPHLIASVIGIVLCAVLLPIVIINLTLVVKSYVYPDKVPTFMGVAPLIVQSGSMESTIGVDDLIFSRSVKAEDLHAQDIIAFLAKADTVVTHRIVAVEKDEEGNLLFTTKGDNNNTADEKKVTASQIVGQYWFRVKGAGRTAMFMKEPIGMVVFVGIPLALFVIYDGLRRALYGRKTRKAEAERVAALEAQLAAVDAAQPAESASPAQGEKAAGDTDV